MSYTLTALCQRQQEKNEVRTCVWEGKKIVSWGWLYHWKEEMRVRVKEGEGKRGEQERFPKLIKCSEGRKLPASIPVPLDKLAHCSLQLLCSAEVASWGHHQRVRGMVGAINSECFCARWLLFILQSCFVGDLLLKLRARAANYHFSCRHHLKWPSTAATLCHFVLSHYRFQCSYFAHICTPDCDILMDV